MSLKNAYREKMAAQLEEQHARLGLFETWREMKGGVEKVWDDLGELCRNTAQKFKDER